MQAIINKINQSGSVLATANIGSLLFLPLVPVNPFYKNTRTSISCQDSFVTNRAAIIRLA